MRTFYVEGIEIQVAPAAAFEFIRAPGNLPRWAHAFKRAGDSSATLETGNGTVEVDLCTVVNEAAGTVDWSIRFPNGAVGLAQSRVTETTRRSCIYSFVLHAPPVPLEQLEGALEIQRQTLRTELATLKEILERS